MNDAKQDTYVPPKQIWLSPWCWGCKGEDHTWCQHQMYEPCEECGREAVRYVIAEPLP